MCVVIADHSLGGREIDWRRVFGGGTDKCGGNPMDPLITAAARAFGPKEAGARLIASGEECLLI
jgi:hypothetical protein